MTLEEAREKCLEMVHGDRETFNLDDGTEIFRQEASEMALAINLQRAENGRDGDVWIYPRAFLMPEACYQLYIECR